MSQHHPRKYHPPVPAHPFAADRDLALGQWPTFGLSLTHANPVAVPPLPAPAIPADSGRDSDSGRHRSFLRSAAGAILLAGVVAFGLAAPADAAGDLTLEEVAQSVDLIFVGTAQNARSFEAAEGRMVGTVVTFGEVEVIHATDRSRQRGQREIDLVHAGGRLERRSVQVSGTPGFNLGERYLVLMLDDGERYANPVVSNQYGLFRIVRDVENGVEYPLSFGDKALMALAPGHLGLSRNRVGAIASGVIQPAEDRSRQNWWLDELPTSEEPGGFVQPSRELAGDVVEVNPLTLPDLLDYIVDTALVVPVEEPVLRFGGGKAMPASKVAGERRSEGKPASAAAPAKSSITTTYSTELSACGYQDLQLTMEQVSTSWWEWGVHNYCMVMWNDTMDVFRYSGDDGMFGGNNGESEFCGYVDDATLSSEYGFKWGGAWAMTVNYVDSDDHCKEIEESDVMFNTVYSWTDDLATHLANPLVLLYRGTAMHETGHTWGLMSGYAKETYAYDHPSVMNSPNSTIVEDGYGVHVPDVWMLRRHYSNQVGIPNTVDLGVESYYAQNGLNTSTLSVTTARPGDSLTISNVTVENLSPTAVSNVRLRFYLSSDRTVTSSDHQLGSYWFSWSSFAAEKYSVANYTVTVPYGVTPGEYYVGAIVTNNGFGTDSNAGNDTTTLYSRVTILPSPPSNVLASDGTYSGKIRVTWGTVTGATSYQVWRASTSGGTATQIATSTSTSYDDTSVGSGFYYYQVRAVSSLGSSNLSDVDEGYAGVMAVTSLDATDGDYTDRVALTWSAAGGATGYEILRSTDEYVSTATVIGSATTASYSDTSAVPEIGYYYWVRAYSDTGSSALSPMDFGWRHLSTPTGLAASSTFTDRVVVTWSTVPYASGFDVYRAPASDFSQATKIVSGTYFTQLDDTSVTQGSTYYYWVRAVNAWGYSDLAGPVMGRCKVPGH